MNSEIRILDQKIPLKTSHEDNALAEDVINLVSARLEAAEARMSGRKVPHQVALLALLDLAEEYLRAKQRVEKFQKKVEASSSHLVSLLDPPVPSA